MPPGTFAQDDGTYYGALQHPEGTEWGVTHGYHPNAFGRNMTEQRVHTSQTQNNLDPKTTAYGITKTKLDKQLTERKDYNTLTNGMASLSLTRDGTGSSYIDNHTYTQGYDTKDGKKPEPKNQYSSYRYADGTNMATDVTTGERYIQPAGSWRNAQWTQVGPNQPPKDVPGFGTAYGSTRVYGNPFGGRKKLKSRRHNKRRHTKKSIRHNKRRHTKKSRKISGLDK